MSKELPIEINCLYAILVKNGNPKDISSIMKLRDVVSYEWELGLKKIRASEKLDDIGQFEMMMVSNQILGWSYLICERNWDLKYSLNCCNELSKEYNEIFSFVIDVHSGDYRFIKIENGKISRFFERDCNSVTGEFGQKIKEEIEIEKENEEHDYFYVAQVAKKVIRLNELSKTNFGSDILVGKRYYRDVENYLVLYDEPNNPKQIDNTAPKSNDLPF